MDEAPMFRASKRRKTAARVDRARSEEPSEDETTSSLVKARSQPKLKNKGVQFFAEKHAAHSNDEQLVSTFVPIDAGLDVETLGGLRSRFVRSGGGSQVVNVDKHMVDYVDRAIAERHRPQTTTPITNGDKALEYTDASSDEGGTVLDVSQHVSSKGSTRNDEQHQAQHLFEVDLGTQATMTNLARTTAALSGHLPEEEAPKRPQRQKPRLGRDGKPLRPRPRKGPNPDDVARNALVEQVLHEHGLGTYDSSGQALAEKSKAPGHDEAADEKMAVKFQQQFLDAMAERQQRQIQQNKNASVPAAAASGPRLGGSRSARARMAEIQAQAAGKEKEK